MNFSIGPSFRTYTIIQAVLIAGLVGFLTRSVNPTRAFLVIALIMVIAFAVSGIRWFQKNSVLPLAAYVLGITAELGLIAPFANHPIVIKVGGLIGPMGTLDTAMLAALLLTVVVGFITGMVVFVDSMVKELLPQGWRTPLWGGLDRQKVVQLRRAG